MRAHLLHGKYLHPERECFMSMTGRTRGNLLPILILSLALALMSLSTPGCLGAQERAQVPPSPAGGSPAITPIPVPPSVIPTVQAPRADPIVGTWYAPIPDDLTFEFRTDGTFTEWSPNFPSYQGTWTRSEENFYDAFILDRWGYRKPAKLLYATGSLMTKGIGTMHRTG
jgi:hypothetical protein